VTCRFVDPVSRRHAALIWDGVDAALRALDVGLDVPVHVVGRNPDAPITAAWASPRGVFLRADVLDEQETLPMVIAEEVAHYWTFKARPVLADSAFHSEVFATWFVGHVYGKTWVPTELGDNTSPYELGKAAGAALALGPDANAYRRLREARLSGLTDLVDRLDTDELGPHQLADALVIDLAASAG
jgi:hypothetical protein